MTRAQRICEAHGVSIEEVCRRARIQPQRLKHLARKGKACCNTAKRLSKIIGCSPDVFLDGERGDEYQGLPKPRAAGDFPTRRTV